jgi:hypothetical protein
VCAGTPFDEDEAILRRPESNSFEGGDPLFECKGTRFYVRNGAGELLLNLCPRALFGVAEQLLGVGEVVWPDGVDPATGAAVGPCYMDEGALGGLKTHADIELDGPAPMRTEQLALADGRGPVWQNGQGTRGLYCTMPGHPDPKHGEVRRAGTLVNSGSNYPGCHSDGGAQDSRVRLRATAFIDDCPPGAGGFTLWPRSHSPIWSRFFSPDGGQADGYTDEVMERVKQTTDPVELSGPAGTVVLWHGVLAHIVGQNATSDTIRAATIYEFHKTPESLPDSELARRNLREGPVDIWEDWSQETRRAAEATSRRDASSARL